MWYYHSAIMRVSISLFDPMKKVSLMERAGEIPRARARARTQADRLRKQREGFELLYSHSYLERRLGNPPIFITLPARTPQNRRVGPLRRFEGVK